MNDWQRHQARLDALRETPYNFDPEGRAGYTAETGWHLDAYATLLPPEPPGPPLPEGDPRASFAVARRLVRDYAFPDPALISGLFVPDDPLPGRPMLLRGRFAGFSFWFGVRVGDEIDEVREAGGDRAHVWGYGYRTLQGHFERGEITFEVWKVASTGEVSFRVHSYSQPDAIGNPFFRLGFRIFGRGLQARFARGATARMRRFVAEELEARRGGTAAPPRETVDVEPAGADAEAEAEMASRVETPR